MNNIEPEIEFAKFRQVELLHADGLSLSSACKAMSVTPALFRLWKDGQYEVTIDQGRYEALLKIENQNLRSIVSSLCISVSEARERFRTEALR